MAMSAPLITILHNGRTAMSCIVAAVKEKSSCYSNAGSLPKACHFDWSIKYTDIQTYLRTWASIQFTVVDWKKLVVPSRYGHFAPA